MDDPVTAWASDVVAGKIIAGPHVRNAAHRHLDDLKRAPARGLEWNLAAANRAMDFFPDVLCLNGGDFEGLPFQLQPVQKFIVGSLFGWLRKATGKRRFRRAYIEMAKGQGKSPLLGGIGLYCMLADGEARAEVYAAASKKDQAKILFRDAVAMVDYSPLLSKRLVKSGILECWQLTDPKTASWFKPISSDDGQSGPRPSCALCDEVHEHRDRNTIDMLERGFKSRKQPMLIMATNSGSDRNTVCWEEHEAAVKVAAGTETPDPAGGYVGEYVNDFTDKFFSFVCSLDPQDDPLTDPSCWVKSNPLLGTIIQPETIKEQVDQANAMPGKANGIMRLHFCQWTDAETSWIARKTLESCLDDFDVSDHHGEKVYIGADLSASKDITALAFVVPTGTKTVVRKIKGKDTNLELPTFDAWVEGWTPAGTLPGRLKPEREQFERWIADGHLNSIPGQIIRLDHVAQRLSEANAEFNIAALAYDRYSYNKLQDEMSALNLEVVEVEHPQGGKRRAKPPEWALERAKQASLEDPKGLWMPGSVKEMEALILEGRIRLRKSPMLVTACMSATLDTDPLGNSWFVKQKATNRIDAVVALAMAVGAATAGWDGKPQGKSFWESEDAVERLMADV